MHLAVPDDDAVARVGVHWATEQCRDLLEVLDDRYATRSTIMTSNRPLEDWGKLLQDVPTAGAILDRFLHHTQVIAITGKSYRLKNATAAMKARCRQAPCRWTPRSRRTGARA